MFLKKKKGILGGGGKKRNFSGKPMEFLCTEMNIYAKQKEERYKYPKQRL